MKAQEESFSNDPVARLIEECLELPASDRDREFAALLEAHPEHRDRITSQLRLLRQAGLLDDRNESSQAGAALHPERLGAYAIEARIGGGGMGVVYSAIEQPLGRRVALKIIRPEFAFFEGSKRRFQREIQAVARLRHENIVSLYAAGEQDGVPYLAMEWVPGASVSDLLARLPQQPLDDLNREQVEAAFMLASPATDAVDLSALGEKWTSMALEIARQVAEALEHAHGRFIVHRDVKPANVMITPKGGVILLDFGLARAEDTSHMTRTGSTLGSLVYMSPEQVRGDAALVGPRSDVYSLGASLFELLCRRPPFVEREPHTLRAAILNGDIVRPRRIAPELSRDIEAVLLTALAREPLQRYSSAGALVRDLTSLLAGEPVEARSPSLLRRFTHWCRRHPTLTTAALLLLVVGPSVLATQASLAQARLQRQVDLTGRHLKIIREDVMGMLRETYRDLGPLPQASKLRQKMLERTRETLYALENTVSPETNLDLELASAHALLGEVVGNPGETGLGTLEESQEHYSQAIGYWRHYLETNPQDRRSRSDIAETELRLASIHRALGNADLANACSSAGLAACEELVKEKPKSRASRLALIAALKDRGYSFADEPERAEPFLLKGRDVASEMLDEDPTDDLARYNFALFQLLRSGLLSGPSALVLLYEARREASRALERHRDSRDHLLLIAQIDIALGAARTLALEWDLAEHHFENAERQLRWLRGRDLDDHAVAFALAKALVAHAQIARGDSEPRRSIELSREIIELVRDCRFHSKSSLILIQSSLLPAWEEFLIECESEQPNTAPKVIDGLLTAWTSVAPDPHFDAAQFANWETLGELLVSASLRSIDRCSQAANQKYQDPSFTASELDRRKRVIEELFPRIEPLWRFVEVVSKLSPTLARRVLGHLILLLEPAMTWFPQHANMWNMSWLLFHSRGKLSSDKASREDLRKAVGAAERMYELIDKSHFVRLRGARKCRWDSLNELARRTSAWPPIPFFMLQAQQALALQDYEEQCDKIPDGETYSGFAWALITCWPESPARFAQALTAIELGRKATKLGPESHDILSTSALARFKAGDLREAVRVQRKALHWFEQSPLADRIDVRLGYEASFSEYKQALETLLEDLQG